MKDQNSNLLNEQVEFFLTFLTENRKNRFFEVLNNRMKYLTVVLEDIYDPHNASACIRSCEANGIQTVYIIEKNYQFTLKEGTAMSAGKWVDIKKFNAKELEPSIECYEYLKKLGYTLYGMVPEPILNKNFLYLDLVEVKTPIALVFGSEKNGLSEISKNYLENFIIIPMYGFVESYNISVACAISVYTIGQKIRNSNINWKLSEIEKKEILLDWLKKEIPQVKF